MGQLSCWYRGHQWEFDALAVARTDGEGGTWNIVYSMRCARCGHDYDEWVALGHQP